MPAKHTDVDEAALFGEDAAAEAPEFDFSAVDPNHPILSVEEQKRAIIKAHERVKETKRQAALKALEEQEQQRLLGKTGKSIGDPMKDELVSITIDLPEFAPSIIVNSEPYYHGQTYTVQRHIADSLREQQARSWNHQNEIEGKGIADRFRRPHNRIISGKAAA